MPTPRKVSSSLLLPSDKDDGFYINEFLSEFGATAEKPAIFKDVLGESLVISDALFTSRSGHSKLKKRGREVYLKLLALALQQPDEIWTRTEHWLNIDKMVVRRRYIARFKIEGIRTNIPALAVFDVGADGWDGITIFTPDKEEYLEQVRTGVMLYYRDDED